MRRNALILLGSFVGHVIAFFVAISNFEFYPPAPAENEQPVEMQIVPPPPLMPPPPPPVPMIKPPVAPTPQAPSPPPTPTPPTKPQPTPTPPQPAQPAPKPTAPAPQAVRPTLAPAPKPAPAPAPSPLAPPTPAPTPGPPKAVPAASLKKPQARTVSAPRLVLHRDRNERAGQPSLSIPGAVFAAPQAPPGQPAGGGATAGGGGPGGFPSGSLPGFGNGLRDSLLGCANAAALHLSPAERAHCAETFGEGTRETQQMDPIGASPRAVLDREAAGESAARRYRDSTPAGTEVRPVAGQPRNGILRSPNQ